MLTPQTPTEDTLYDLAIIGGGITGAAVARDAALRGLKTILFEKTDFGAGASTKTSKLAHGGLRYLEYGEIGLVRESLRERNRLLNLCSPWVKPLPFLFPVYDSSRRPLWQIATGIRLYQCMAGESSKKWQRRLSADAVGDRVKGLCADGLRGAAGYTDAQMQDGRLVIENIRSSLSHGAQAYNYSDVVSVRRAATQWHTLSIKQNSAQFDVSARCVVNATGAWSNDVLNRIGVERKLVAPSKGVHVVLPDIGLDAALVLEAPQDRRIFFVLPWEQRTLIGTTDTFSDDDPGSLTVNKDDVRYLLEAFQRYFLERSFDEDDVVATFAGLRPLISSKPGHAASAASRTHRIVVDQDRVISVAGGKFTTYRAMAEAVVDLVARRLGETAALATCQTDVLPLWAADESIKNGAPSDAMPDHWPDFYGPRATEMATLMQARPDLAEPISPDFPYLKAELYYGIQNERVHCLEDWLERRTPIALSRKLTPRFIKDASVTFETMRGAS
ncbi:MAG: glycerol-3-phosphate dehydrogenase/oxidase [Kiritimatiellae bacterium]|nr:glycerol-3-phosphate dehydrogenase/oxidase [Kiritimatiellia bacterium]